LYKRSDEEKGRAYLLKKGRKKKKEKPTDIHWYSPKRRSIKIRCQTVIREKKEGGIKGVIRVKTLRARGMTKKTQGERNRASKKQKNSGGRGGGR